MRRDHREKKRYTRRRGIEERKMREILEGEKNNVSCNIVYLYPTLLESVGDTNCA